jgi:hypothetical protein
MTQACYIDSPNNYGEFVTRKVSDNAVVETKLCAEYDGRFTYCPNELVTIQAQLRRNPRCWYVLPV